MKIIPFAARALSLALSAMVTWSILAGIDALAHPPVGADPLLAVNPSTARET